MTLSAHDAEDLVQEVCLKAFENLDRLESIEYRRAWLLKVMYNKFVDGWRGNSRSPVDNAATGADSRDPDQEAAGKEAQPEKSAEREQTIEAILLAMRCLSAENCALVAMHDVEGLTIKELSNLSGMPEGTVKARLHRTRAKLGRLLAGNAAARPQLKLVGEPE